MKNNSKKERIAFATPLYVAGVPTQVIYKRMCEKLGTEIKYGTFKNDIVAIRKNLAKSFVKQKEVDYSGEFLARSMDLYRGAKANKQYATAFNIILKIAGLFGVDFEGISSTVGVKSLANLTDEDLDDAIDVLAKKAGVNLELIEGTKSQNKAS